jgi:hypothetical protein
MAQGLMLFDCLILIQQRVVERTQISTLIIQLLYKWSDLYIYYQYIWKVARVDPYLPELASQQVIKGGKC